MDKDFVRQIELMTEQSLCFMRASPPSPARVKEEPATPPHHRGV